MKNEKRRYDGDKNNCDSIHLKRWIFYIYLLIFFNLSNYNQLFLKNISIITKFYLRNEFKQFKFKKIIVNFNLITSQ